MTFEINFSTVVTTLFSQIFRLLWGVTGDFLDPQKPVES